MVIDTSIFIEYLQAKNRSQTTLAQMPVGAYYVSDITVYELFSGATDVKKWQEVELVLEAMMRLPFNHAVAVDAAKIYLHLRSHGLMIGFKDIFIGTTALLHQYPVKTLNVKDFSKIPGLQLT
ncbi:MAG: type II toxin-antitoxin system VapC family toxin [Bacteroidota bacterium]